MGNLQITCFKTKYVKCNHLLVRDALHEMFNYAICYYVFQLKQSSLALHYFTLLIRMYKN